MNRLLLLVLTSLCLSVVADERPPADEILAFVRGKLPDRPMKLTGSLKVKAPNGFTKSNLPVSMELDWGAAAPSAKYAIGKEALTITWNNNVPSYAFSNPQNKPTDDILGSGVNWSDLSFSVLWWPNSRLEGEGRKINRACHIIDVPVPGSDKTMRLWIEKSMGMLLEAQTLDKKMKPLRRVKIKSIKKMDGMWVGSDMEIKDMKTRAKTDLLVHDLEWTGPAVEAPPIVETAAAFDPAESINHLALDLYQQAAKKEGNIVLSPYSISTALAMTYAGARGETAAQMNETLHFGGQGATHPAFKYLRAKLDAIQEKGDVELSVANSLWPQKGYDFLPDYLALTKEFYGARIENVPLKSDPEAARKRINSWIEEKTNNKIKNLIPEGALDGFTRLVLANAVYFKGNWATQFNKKHTRDEPFSITSDKTVSVPMMSQEEKFLIASGPGFKALELPYEGRNLSMVVLLPEEKDGLSELGKSLTSKTLADLSFRKTEIMVQLPKFKFDWKLELSDTLAAMGMPTAFSLQADFSGMAGTKRLFIAAVIHQAFIEVNEEGTEAAAATAVQMMDGFPPSFTANHPFLFLIRENATGAILFIGRVVDPTT